MTESDNAFNCSIPESQGDLLMQDSKESKIRNPILCNHCKRTKDNGISCLGKCVADNEY